MAEEAADNWVSTECVAWSAREVDRVRRCKLRVWGAVYRQNNFKFQEKCIGLGDVSVVREALVKSSQH